jgi:hypothetical protein
MATSPETDENPWGLADALRAKLSEGGAPISAYSPMKAPVAAPDLKAVARPMSRTVDSSGNPVTPEVPTQRYAGSPLDEALEYSLSDSQQDKFAHEALTSAQATLADLASKKAEIDALMAHFAPPEQPETPTAAVAEPPTQNSSDTLEPVTYVDNVDTGLSEALEKILESPAEPKAQPATGAALNDEQITGLKYDFGVTYGEDYNPESNDHRLRMAALRAGREKFPSASTAQLAIMAHRNQL